MSSTLPGSRFGAYEVKGVLGRLVQLSTDKRPRGVTWAPDGKRVIIGLAERSADIVLFDQGR
jgi:hypothetical protein